MLILKNTRMNAQDLREFKAWFAGYAARYCTGDPVHDEPVKLKQVHTERVCGEILALGKALRLSENDLLLAETMALFHDLGRFEQYARYGTFQDAASENHAGLSLKELARHGVLTDCSRQEQLLITKSIAVHNVRTLPLKGDDRRLFFARLLRDADKLDIWRVFIDYYEEADKGLNATIIWGLPDNQTVSAKILQALAQGKMADTRHMAGLNDFKLLQISWVFDLNFKPAFEAVRERRYVERIADVLPGTKEIGRAVDVARRFLEAATTPLK